MPGEPNELVLVRRCIRGDESAWRVLYRAQAPGLLGRLIAFLRGRRRPAPQREEAEEVLARVFASLVENNFALLRSFRGESSLAGWLAVVAVRGAQNYLRAETRERARRTRAVTERARPEVSLEAGLEALQRDEAIDVLRGVTEGLSPRDRLILRLHFIEGLSYKEVADRVRVSPNSVGPLVARAAERLRRLLGRD